MPVYPGALPESLLDRHRAAVTRRPPSRPGELHPEPLTGPDVSLSTYPARTTLEGCRLPPRPAGSSCCQLTLIRSPRRSPAPFAPRELPRFPATTEQSAPDLRIGTFGLAVLPLVPFPLVSLASQVLKFPTKARTGVTPPVHRTSPGQYAGFRQTAPGVGRQPRF